MPTRAAAAALLGAAGAGGEEEEDEEEEDEPLALPVPAASRSSSSSKRPAAAAGEGDEGMRQPDVKRARSGKVRSTDVGELQAALEEAEARIEGFQAREAEYLRRLAEQEAEGRELRSTMAAMAAFHSPTEAWMRRAVMDPGIALELRMLHEKVLGLEAEARKAREEAQAAQFSSQSAAGQMALAMVRKLQEQNAQLTSRLEAVDQAREERARLQAEIEQLKKKLAEAEAVNDQTDEDRSLLTTMVFTLKKQLAQYEQAGGEAGAAGGVKMEG